MGLMQLLTVGRSLSEARDRPHRYKLLDDAMPTFGLDGATTGRSGVSTGEQTRADMNSEVATETNTTKQAYPLGRWTRKANPFNAAKRPVAPTVQGELSLDKVRVVRNDLTDADLELVAVQKAPENVFAAAPAPVQAGLEPKRSLWLRVKGWLVRKRA